MHSSASETYFLELSYHSLPANYTMPVDEYGKAHIFDIVDEMVNIHNSKPSTSEMPEAQLASKLSASTQHFLGLRLCFHTRKKAGAPAPRGQRGRLPPLPLLYGGRRGQRNALF